MPSELDSFGRRGEAIAEKHLKSKGMRILARRYRIVGGELDLIATDGETVVFVEVKSQTSTEWNAPQDRVGSSKRTRMTRAARAFVKQKHLEDRPCRFDVVGVIMAAEKSPLVEHFCDAFVPRKW